MADEDPWGAGDEEEIPAAATTAPTSKSGSKSASKAGSKSASKAGTGKNTPSRAETPTGDAAPADGEPLPEAEVPPQEDPNRPRPVLLFKHWVR